MDKKFWGILGGLIVIAIILAIIFAGGNTSAPSNAQPTEHIKGSTKSGLKLVEYGDYECPFCAEYYPIVKQVNALYDNLIQFQFRNFPLTEIHQNALAGARAAEAAAMQGQFWGMHDLLYENNEYDQQAGWVVSNDPLNDYFVGYAKQLKLNIPKFKQDYASSQTNALVQADMAAGNKLNIQGTPTFFLNGQQIKPGIALSSFETIINAALKKKGIAPPPNAIPTSNSQPTQGSAQSKAKK